MPSLESNLLRNTMLSYQGAVARNSSAADWILSGFFDCFFVGVIAANTVLISVEMQYSSFDIGMSMGIEDFDKPGSQEWPGAVPTFRACEIVFGILYTAEIAMKVYALGRKYLKCAWHALDLLIVAMFYLEMIGELLGFFSGGDMDLVLLRLARFAKVLRIVKLVKNVRMLDPLTLMISSIGACAPVLLWSMLLLFAVHLLTSLFVHSTVRDFLENDAVEAERREVVFEYFGSFTRAQVSMFELTMGNWIPITRGLAENIDESWGAFFVIYKIVVGFAIMKVVSGIFLHETFKCAATDDHIMILTKQRAYSQHVTKMSRLLKDADTGGDGMMDKAEFISVISKADIKMWLAAQEIEVRDPEAVFNLLDKDGDGIVERAELVARFAHMKGAARSVDLLLLSGEVAEVQCGVLNIIERLSSLEEALTFGSRCPDDPLRK